MQVGRRRWVCGLAGGRQQGGMHLSEERRLTRVGAMEGSSAYAYALGRRSIVPPAAVVEGQPKGAGKKQSANGKVANQREIVVLD